MKRINSGIATVVAGLGLSFACLPALADNVRQLDEQTLQVVDFQGKPPFKRRTVSALENPSEFARIEELSERQPRPLFAAARRGVPGKSLPQQSQRISSDPAEFAEFARFEETAEEPVESPRIWRGAPGKGRPHLLD